MKTGLKNTSENKALIEALKTIKQTQWVGNTVHTSMDACVTAINLYSNNSGWYKPMPIDVPGLIGNFIVNENGTIFYDARIIKEGDKAYRIEYMTMAAYNNFEQKYRELIKKAFK